MHALLPGLAPGAADISIDAADLDIHLQRRDAILVPVTLKSMSPR
jgi:hypothetical protein